jgi:hypothetical protein
MRIPRGFLRISAVLVGRAAVLAQASGSSVFPSAYSISASSSAAEVTFCRSASAPARSPARLTR